ncbi:sperm microtubule associated protein 1-like [Narcine bancroftii]|uniref:sperm microtubule associated protein 1-like n=1 Tax=Narcine bancroftii TaxID=1343680 RepID=UPI003831D6E2
MLAMASTMNSARCPLGVRCLDCEYFKRERDFILDGVAVSSNALTYEKVQPKLCGVIPPYNAQKDPYAKHAFQTKAMKRLLKKTEQDQGGTSNSGWLVDYFYKNGSAQKYLTRRNAYGAGHSYDQIVGHRGYLSDVKPIVGYNGKFGYRRNTPGLREKPSVFREVSNFPLY